MVPLKSWAGVALVVVVTFGLTVLGAVLASGTVLAPAIAIIGWLIVAPVLAILTYYEDEETESTESAPLSTLRERYARGELTEEEFERRTERLIETESESERTKERRERERVRER